jgi:tRNA(Ile)-lysidine synthase
LSDAAARFAADWADLWPGPEPIGLAVSGGPDSLGLLLLACDVLGVARIAVATVDHGLRPDSSDEAAMVARICAALGVTHDTLRLAMTGGTAVQQRARIARYRALDAWAHDRGLGALVTAHHADDQAETLIMRMNRGVGLRGLAGMRARAVVPGGTLPLLRPLLGWRRLDLAGIVAGAGITAVDDPSNRAPQFERVRVRAGLARASWIDPAGMAATAAHLAQADAALDWAAAQITAGELPGDPALPRALVLRVLERVLAQIGTSVPRGRDIARWHDRLAAGKVATLAGVRGDGRNRPWRFTPAAPHQIP